MQLYLGKTDWDWVTNSTILHQTLLQQWNPANRWAPCPSPLQPFSAAVHSALSVSASHWEKRGQRMWLDSLVVGFLRERPWTTFKAKKKKGGGWATIIVKITGVVTYTAQASLLCPLSRIWLYSGFNIKMYTDLVIYIPVNMMNTWYHGFWIKRFLCVCGIL